MNKKNLKDLGELLKINVDSNQKHYKDDYSEIKFPTGKDSKKPSNKFKKLKEKMKGNKIN
jgi:hypothetical protein